MCSTCGCEGDGNIKILFPGEKAEVHSHHSHDHHHGHSHDHEHDHQHDHGHHSHHTHASEKVILEQEIMGKNNLVAERNRGFFEGRNIFTINLVSSPGSGKTTILEKSLPYLMKKFPVTIIEGDQQTSNDADRIHKTGAPVVQINTGQGCHLDADMIQQAIQKLNPEPNSILFIENVGNLVCPGLFDLGESERVVIISVTEGEDKPLKYPIMFQGSKMCLVNKTDLLPYVDFNLENLSEYCKKVNPNIEMLNVSATQNDGLNQWIEWVEKKAETKLKPYENLASTP